MCLRTWNKDVFGLMWSNKEKIRKRYTEIEMEWRVNPNQETLNKFNFVKNEWNEILNQEEIL